MGDSGWRTTAAALVFAVIAVGCSPTTTVVSDDGATAETSTTDLDEPGTQANETSADSAEAVAPPAPAVVADAIEGPDLDPRGLAVVEPGRDLAPESFSTIAQAGDLGFYYTALDGDMTLIAFDTESLSPQYEIPASPLGRIRGVRQDVVVDADLGLVFVTGYDESIGGEAGSYLAGHDALTGAELWRTSIDYYSGQPFDCGPSICVRSTAEQRWIDKGTGSLVDFARTTDRRVLYSSEALTVTSSVSFRTGGFSGIVATADHGTDVIWELTADAIAEATGHVVDPSFGWSAEFFEESDVVIVYLAREDSTGWAAAGIDSRTGQVLWANDQFAPCLETPLDDHPPLVCVTGAEAFVQTGMQLIDARSGDAIWRVDGFPESGVEVIYDGAKLIVWQFADDGTSANFEVDTVTGEQTPGPSTAVCGYQSEWQDFEYPDGDVLDFASALVFSMCSNDGYLLYPDEVITLAPSIGLESATPVWLVDFDGAPLLATG